MDFNTLDIGMIVAAILVVVGGLIAYWRKSPAERQEVREELVRTMVAKLVAEAELTITGQGAGAARREWVMGKLKERFPGLDQQMLLTMLEVAHKTLEARQAATGNLVKLLAAHGDTSYINGDRIGGVDAQP